MLKKLLLLIAATGVTFAMHTGEININNDDIEAELKFDMGQFNPELDVDNTYVGVRYIYADNKYDADELVEVSYLMKKPLDKMKELSIGIGFKVDYSSVDAFDFLALPLGIEARYHLPVNAAVPIYVGAEVYYAPSVLSFSDAENYLEFKANIDVEIIKRGLITAGYRRIDTNYEAGDLKFNQAAFIGFKFVF